MILTLVPPACAKSGLPLPPPPSILPISSAIFRAFTPCFNASFPAITTILAVFSSVPENTVMVLGFAVVTSLAVSIIRSTSNRSNFCDTNLTSPISLTSPFTPGITPFRPAAISLTRRFFSLLAFFHSLKRRSTVFSSFSLGAFRTSESLQSSSSFFWISSKAGIPTLKFILSTPSWILSV